MVETFPASRAGRRVADPVNRLPSGLFSHLALSNWHTIWRPPSTVSACGGSESSCLNCFCVGTRFFFLLFFLLAKTHRSPTPTRRFAAIPTTRGEKLVREDEGGGTYLRFYSDRTLAVPLGRLSDCALMPRLQRCGTLDSIIWQWVRRVVARFDVY